MGAGLAVIAISSMKPEGLAVPDPDPDKVRLDDARCYGDMSDPAASPDAAVMSGIMRLLMEREHLAGQALYAYGWSSGARMALMMPAVMEFRVGGSASSCRHAALGAHAHMRRHMLSSQHHAAAHCRASWQKCAACPSAG